MYAQLVISGIITVMILLLLAFLLIRRTAVATIAGFSWRRQVWLEQYLWVKESSYRGYPKGSRNRESAINEADKTAVMSTMPAYLMITGKHIIYTYEVRRWCSSRELLAQGEERNDICWPPYRLDDQLHERVRKTREKYLVHFQTADGKKYQQALTEREWMALDAQGTYRLHITLYGKVMHIAPGIS